MRSRDLSVNRLACVASLAIIAPLARGQVTIEFHGSIQTADPGFKSAVGATGDRWSVRIADADTQFTGSNLTVLPGGAAATGVFGGQDAFFTGHGLIGGGNGAAIQLFGFGGFATDIPLSMALPKSVLDFNLLLDVGGAGLVEWDGLVFLPLGSLDKLGHVRELSIDVSPTDFSAFEISSLLGGDVIVTGTIDRVVIAIPAPTSSLTGLFVCAVVAGRRRRG